MRAVLAETTSEMDNPSQNDNRRIGAFEEIMDDDTAEFDTFARQIEEMTKSNDYSEEREFGDLPPLKSSSSDLYCSPETVHTSPSVNYYMESAAGGHSTSHSYRCLNIHFAIVAWKNQFCFYKKYSCGNIKWIL